MVCTRSAERGPAPMHDTLASGITRERKDYPLRPQGFFVLLSTKTGRVRCKWLPPFFARSVSVRSGDWDYVPSLSIETN